MTMDKQVKLKELIIKSKKFPNLAMQIFNGKEFGLLWDETSDDNFSTDNEEYAYEVYKLLQEAKNRGAFNKYLKEKKDKEEIYI